MKPHLLLVLLALSAPLAGCNTKGIPVEYAHICDPANDKKTIAVDGYLKNVGSVMCSSSKTVPHMTCPVRFVDAPGASGPLTANIDLGKGPNEIDKESLGIRDDKGQLIGDQDKVTLTGKVSVFVPPPRDKAAAACYFIVVKKIEKR